jgi:hypothetical protein
MSDIRLTTAIDAENPVAHDLEVRAGQIVWVGLDPYDAEDQGDMIAQRCRCQLRWLAAEWYLDQREGVPWQQTLMQKGVTRARIARVIRAALRGVPGVRLVRSVEVTSDPVTRRAVVTFDVVGYANATVPTSTLDMPFLVRAEE